MEQTNICFLDNAVIYLTVGSPAMQIARRR
jgi:hypothetical protein